MSYELKVERLIDAPLEEVFDAYIDPEAHKVWFTIFDPGMNVETEVDLRVGGKWVSRWGFSPSAMFWETQTFEVIDRPHRLVTRSTGGSPDGLSLDTKVEITFTDEGGKTRMTVVQTGFPEAEVRDFFANTAWIGFFDRFAAYFEARARS
jgi:uncharacterized protein YndB with AHSA1/START domain